MTPLVGVQTPIALGLALLFKLSKTDVWLSTYVMNPWTILPILMFERWLGGRIVGATASPDIRWDILLSGSFVHAFDGLGSMDLIALFAGGAVVALASGALAFLGVRSAIGVAGKHPTRVTIRRSGLPDFQR
jgi:uncharacterized protein (DUF2062 family)